VVGRGVAFLSFPGAKIRYFYDTEKCLILGKIGGINQTVYPFTKRKITRETAAENNV